MRFKDKSVIITGGGGKIGKAYALGFAKEGGKVALPDIASADPSRQGDSRYGRHGDQYGLRRVR